METIEVKVNDIPMQIELSFSRRRYGNETCTWVSAKGADGKWVELGDPWYAIKPKKAEVVRAIELRIESKELIV